MKRFSIILLGVLLLCPYVFSQSEAPEQSEFSQSGKAIHSTEIEGFSALHHSLPLDSKIKIENTETKVEIELTIVGNISHSPDFLVNISLDAWEALDLNADTIIKVTYTPATSEEESAEGSAVVEVEVPAPSAVPQPTEQSEEGSALVPPPIAVSRVEDYQPSTRVEAPSPLVPGRDIRVIPGMPNPNSGKVYRLQVGAYSVVENADQSASLLRSGGFRVEREMFDSKHRVLAVGITAADVYAAVQKMGELGFSVVWVRE